MLHRRLMAIAVTAVVALGIAAAPVAAHSDSHDGDHHVGSTGGYTVTPLVTGPSPDSDLVNAWGLSRGPGTPWWVSDNGSDSSTLYRGDGSKVSLVVSIPGGEPTGTVFNPGAASGDFKGDTFLFASEAGMITGWRTALGTTAEVGSDQSARGAVYKGLAIGMADKGSGPAPYLYATDFHNGHVDVFDKTYTLQSWSKAFKDKHLPKGYAPFGIQTIGDVVYVTYAKRMKGSDDERDGRGLGIVDAYTTGGHLLGRVATRGPLDAPWGIALAPSDFGRFSGDLIIGNFGDGKLLAYKWSLHHWWFDGFLSASSAKGCNSKPIVIDGLWAIAFGGGTTNNGPTNSLFYTAGPDDESGGAFGTVTVASH